MKALLIRDEFIRRIDTYPSDIYEMSVQTHPTDYSDPTMTATDLSYRIMRNKIVYWIFRLDRIEKIDGEDIAFYKFKEER